MSNANSVFSALADENRRKILVMISNESMNVNAIAGKFKISRPAISKHLRILENSDLVHFKKEGRERYYILNPKPIKSVYEWLEPFRKMWEDRFNRLDNILNNLKTKIK